MVGNIKVFTLFLILLPYISYIFSNIYHRFPNITTSTMWLVLAATAQGAVRSPDVTVVAAIKQLFFFLMDPLVMTNIAIENGHL